MGGVRGGNEVGVRGGMGARVHGERGEQDVDRRSDLVFDELNVHCVDGLHRLGLSGPIAFLPH